MVVINPMIYVSALANPFLDYRRSVLKHGILDKISQAGFLPQEFGVSGSLQGMAWSFTSVRQAMERCRGAVILGFPRWTFTSHEGEVVSLASEFCHFEGGLALSYQLPTLILADETVKRRGILSETGDQHILTTPSDADLEWLKSSAFTDHFDAWCKEVEARYHDYFISYAREDTEFALKLGHDLSKYGVTTWRDEQSIDSGEDWQERLATAIKSCKAVLVILSPDSLASKWVQRELSFADQQEKKVLPVLFRSSELPGWFTMTFGRVQREDFSHGDYDTNLNRLLASIKRMLSLRPKE